MPTRPKTVRWRAALAIAITLALAGVACGSDDADGADEATPDGPPPEASEPLQEDPPGYVSEVYRDLEFWHCHPDLAEDVCSGDLDATEVSSDGGLTEMPFVAAEEPAFDCFYVYPTLDYATAPGNHPFDEDNVLEPIAVRGQAARFGELCELYVPRYRQATIGSYDEVVDGELFEVPAFATAYADVLDAFTHYLANDNAGRPLVLLGHSQGSHHLVRLVQEQFDGSEDRRDQLISALLIGPTGRVTVPEGEVVGGSFENLPLCQAADQTTCVVAFDSFAASRPPESDPDDTPLADGFTTACVNPAGFSDSPARLAGGYFGPTVAGVQTPFELIGDYYTATCAESADGWPYLEIEAAPAPGDTRRLTHIDSRLAQSESLHTLDYNFALRDLLALVESQATAFGL
jgi:hypothetical protein